MIYTRDRPAVVVCQVFTSSPFIEKNTTHGCMQSFVRCNDTCIQSEVFGLKCLFDASCVARKCVLSVYTGRDN